MQVSSVYRQMAIICWQIGGRRIWTVMLRSQTLDYTKNHFPANNYALVLADHGRGYASFCYDYHAPHPYYDYASNNNHTPYYSEPCWLGINKTTEKASISRNKGK